MSIDKGCMTNTEHATFPPADLALHASLTYATQMPGRACDVPALRCGCGAYREIGFDDGEIDAACLACPACGAAVGDLAALDMLRESGSEGVW